MTGGGQGREGEGKTGGGKGMTSAKWRRALLVSFKLGWMIPCCKTNALHRSSASANVIGDAGRVDDAVTAYNNITVSFCCVYGYMCNRTVLYKS